MIRQCSPVNKIQISVAKSKLTKTNLLSSVLISKGGSHIVQEVSCQFAVEPSCMKMARQDM